MKVIVTQEVNLDIKIEKLIGDDMHPAINASLVELGIVKEINTSNCW